MKTKYDKHTSQEARLESQTLYIKERSLKKRNKTYTGVLQGRLTGRL